MRMDNEVLKDILQWDVSTWAYAIELWNEKLSVFSDPSDVYVLDIGARDGGTSLFFARLGMKCVCSDVNGPTQRAHDLHEKYCVTNKITYASVDCTHIPYDDNTFDVVAFKSVLGSIGSYVNKAAIETAMREIYRVLKPGGLLLFAENMEGSPIHMFLRKNFIKWGKRWFYVSLTFMSSMLAPYRKKELYTYGIFACLKNDMHCFEFMDKVFCRKRLSKNHYMAYGCAVK